MAGPSRPLVDLEQRRPGLSRAMHGLVWRRDLRQVGASCVTVLADVAGGLARDAVRSVRDRPAGLVLSERGSAALPSPCTRVALYAHYSPGGGVSDMVLAQLESYRALGFAVVFISMAPSLPPAAVRAAARHAAMVLHRREHGRDFGAWRDALAQARRLWPGIDELLLVNDSVLGPMRGLDSDLAALRGGGDGLFGMLESWQGGRHLQSWFLLARGRRAVDDLGAFLGGLTLTSSKWLLVQRAELRLAQHMLARGHRVAARYGYAAMVEQLIAHPEERDYLVRWRPRLAPLIRPADGQGPARLRRRLHACPLNPTHHLWRVLLRDGFPFVKTDLLRRNPGALPELDAWADQVPDLPPGQKPRIAAHLLALEEPARVPARPAPVAVGSGAYR